MQNLVNVSETPSGNPISDKSFFRLQLAPPAHKSLQDFPGLWQIDQHSEVRIDQIHIIESFSTLALHHGLAFCLQRYIQTNLG